MSVTISEDNTFAGNVGVRLFTPTAIGGEIYGDGGTFREGPVEAETSYYEDADSQTDYGVIEDVLLESGMSDAAANAKAYTTLKAQAWPRAKPPNEGVYGGKDGLSVVFYGYIYTARNRFALSTGPDTATNLVTAALAQCAYLTAGRVETNALVYQADDRAPLTCWDVLRDITLAGDASGNRWNCGVYGDRTFEYEVDPAIGGGYTGHWRDGLLWNMAGGLKEPWFALPGLVYMDDMPVGPADISGNDADDPRAVWLDELEFDAAAWLKDGRGLKFRREVTGE
jgi:hypothetical protein